jgi:hypothetical protein
MEQNGRGFDGWIVQHSDGKEWSEQGGVRKLIFTKNLRLTQTYRRIRQVYEGRYSMHIARRTTKTKLGGRERLVGDRAEVSL